MISKIRARYVNGQLTPLEPLDLEEGAEVMVSVEEAPLEPPVLVENAPPAKQGLAAIVERITELHKSLPPDSWDDLPTDLAKNKKHYLYGHPKEETR